MGTCKITSRLLTPHRGKVEAISKRCWKTRMFTPMLVYTDDFLYMLSNVSSLVPIELYQVRTCSASWCPEGGVSVDNIAHATLHRNSVKRYLKYAITNCCWGRKDPWRESTRVPNRERAGSLRQTRTSSSELWTSSLFQLVPGRGQRPVRVRDCVWPALEDPEC